MKKLLSGVKPTGRPHIGNYLGAMKQFVALQDSYEPLVFIADYHALTTVQNKEELSQATLDLALDYLAIGLDPEKVTLFKQSDVPEVAELAWIFNCITTVPYLMRAHAFKDAEAKNKEINVGVFDYPILMAADILIHDSELIPVGEDQRQHVEYARDIAEKFNRIFGETFVLPEARIMDAVKTIPGLDGRKMSKSYNNTIPLFADSETIKKAVMSIPTDSRGVDEPKDTENDNLYQLHKLLTPEPEFSRIREGYEKGGLSYKESKDVLIKSMEDMLAPLREKRAELAKDPEKVKEILKAGGVKAKASAEAKMKLVREKIGILQYGK